MQVNLLQSTVRSGLGRAAAETRRTTLSPTRLDGSAVHWALTTQGALAASTSTQPSSSGGLSASASTSSWVELQPATAAAAAAGVVRPKATPVSTTRRATAATAAAAAVVPPALVTLRKAFKPGAFDLKLKGEHLGGRQLRQLLATGQLRRSALTVNGNGQLAVSFLSLLALALASLTLMASPRRASLIVNANGRWRLSLTCAIRNRRTASA